MTEYLTAKEAKALSNVAHNLNNNALERIVCGCMDNLLDQVKVACNNARLGLHLPINVISDCVSDTNSKNYITEAVLKKLGSLGYKAFTNHNTLYIEWHDN